MLGDIEKNNIMPKQWGDNGGVYKTSLQTVGGARKMSRGGN
jgi:hypothetical protein